jgi:amino acid adenylation domain-containing protein
VNAQIQASYHQERLWFIDKFETGNLYEFSPVYHNIPLIVDVKGVLNIDLLEKSIRYIISRHAVLRTCIDTIDDRPIQRIAEIMDFKLSVLDLCGDNNRGIGLENAVALAVEESQRPFLLAKEPLIRGQLIKVEDQRSLLVITIHHIIMDKYSLGILLREVLLYYDACLKNGTPEMPGLSFNYTDFSQWQREFPPKVSKLLLRYWKMKLRGKVQPLELPTDRPRARVHTYKAAISRFTIPGEVSDRIEDFCKREGISHFALLLAVFKVLLYRYSGRGANKIIVGTTCFNRNQPGTEELIGPVANLLPLLGDFSPTLTFREFLLDLSRTVKEAYKYQSMPFDKLVSELNPEKDMSRTALFDVLFQYEETPLQIPRMKNLELTIIETNLGWGKYDLNLLLQGGDCISGILVYNCDYYDDSTISRLVGHYRILLNAVVENPDRQVSTFCLLTAEEQQQLLMDWNRTLANYPADKTIQQIFENQLERTPHRSALVYENRELTYMELNRQANRIVHHMQYKYNIHPGDLIGVMMERSEWMIIGLLAILKTGGAYVPIDPNYPEKRIQFILRDSHCQLLITHEESENILRGDLADLAIDILTIPIPGAILAENHIDSNMNRNPVVVNTSEDPSYVIYTSGTTGSPKGCMISHKNIVRLLKNDRLRQLFDFNRYDIWIMAHSFCFDFSVWEMYGALLNGSRLIIPSRDAVRDIYFFHRLIKLHKITVLNQTPGAFYRLLAVDKEAEEKNLSHHMHYVIFGGDKLEPFYLKEWVEIYPLEKISLINMYGITETTVHVTFYRLTRDDIESSGSRSPIGKPLPETTLYIYNENLILEPVGISGEIYVGGSGVSRGYLNQPYLTKRRFIKNPYHEGEVIYRTGDLGKRLPDGNIEYIGRKDHQVKIRGFRIELGEIEAQLLKHNEIREAIVLMHCKERADASPEVFQTSEDRYLCAYVVADKELSIPEMREYLSHTLPDYMIPSYLIQVDRIPLTSNGKLNRKALPKPEVRMEKGEYTSPRSRMEEKLVEIWSEVLGTARNIIGIDGNFFELGGHSLKATTLISKIHRVFNIKIPIAEIFTTPTIRGLSRYLEDAVEDKFTVIKPVEKKEYYTLSSVQKRLYIFQQSEPSITNYNLPRLFELDGELDKQRVEDTFRKLIKRHESLRTSFYLLAEEPVQKIHDDVDFEIEQPTPPIRHRQLSQEGNSKASRSPLPGGLSEGWDGAFIRSFDLSQAPLLRVKLIKAADRKYLIAADMHHIITDGVSLDIFCKDFMALYFGSELPQLRIQYKDFSHWQNNLLKSEKIKLQEEYWLKEFGKKAAPLTLPTDFQRPAARSFEGERIIFELDKKTTEALNLIAKEEGATLFLVLLTQFYILFSKMSGQEDITIGTALAGRRHTDLEPVMGMFVNTLALRNFPAREKSFKEFLKEVKERTLKAFENQDYQFEELVIKTAPREGFSRSRHPLFDVGFLLQNIEVQEIKIPGLTLKPCEFEYNTSKFDLSFIAREEDGKIVFLAEYWTGLFKREKVQLFCKYFKEIITVSTADKDVKLKDIRVSPHYIDQKIENPQIKFGF